MGLFVNPGTAAKMPPNPYGTALVGSSHWLIEEMMPGAREESLDLARSR
jgi:hypothetical protein